MRKLTSILLCCVLLIGLMLPVPVLAAGSDEEPWSNEYYRIMDTTHSLTDEEIQRLDDASIEILRTYHQDVAIAAITEERLLDYSMEDFAAELYESCGFGYGESKDGFMCLYLEDTGVLAVVPIGGAANALPAEYLAFMEERVPSLRENNGMYGIFYGCQELLRSGLEVQAEKANGETEPATEPATDPAAPSEDPADGEFERYGESDRMPAWFPVNLEEAHPYFDPEAPRVVDYAGIISDETEKAMEARIAEITREIGKDIVIVTDVSNYGLGDDIYAADFYDYNGYGIGPEHEGILLFLDMNPNDRGGWTVETGPETRALATHSAINRLDDLLYETLASGDYELALTDWIEDVYGFLTTGIARPAFWYRPDGEIPKDYYDPDAPVVVDEWGLLNEVQIATLEAKAEAIKDTYGVNVYFHTTKDQMGFGAAEYNARYMAAMGYEKDAVLFTVENTDGNTVEFSNVYLYGDMQERIPEKFHSRIENNASAASDGYGRLLEGQRLLAAYLKNGRVPRNGFYWALIGILSAIIGFFGGLVPLRIAESSMETVHKQTSAHSYLVRNQTKVHTISQVLLYTTRTRTYIPPRDTGTRSSSSGGGSSYKSSYSGHSGTSHTGHGRKF